MLTWLSDMGNFMVKYKLTQEEKIYLLANTEFCDDEIEHWYQGFTKDYPKGKITLEEYIETFKTLFQDGNSSDQMISALFKSSDGSNKGYLDFTRFLLSINNSMHRSARKYSKNGMTLVTTY